MINIQELLQNSIITNRPSLLNPMKKTIHELLVVIQFVTAQREGEKINFRIRKIYLIILIQ